MMKGFAAIALTLLFLLATLALSGLNAALNAQDAKARNEALALEEMRGTDLAFKSAVEQALRDSRGATRKQAVVSAAEKLEKLEAFFEEDRRINVWFGSATAAELDALPAKMLETGKPERCTLCWSLSARGLGWDNEPLPLAAALLDYDGSVKVSRNGASLFETPPPIAGEAGFGLSFCDGERAAVYFVREGFP